MPGQSVHYSVWHASVRVDTSPDAESHVGCGRPAAAGLSPNGTHVRPTMTRDSQPDADVSTPAAFNAALADLLVRAHAEGIDVQGAWACRSGDGSPDWEAAVVELDDGN